MAFQEDESANGLQWGTADGVQSNDRSTIISKSPPLLIGVGWFGSKGTIEGQSAQMAEREAKFNKERTMN